MGRVLTDSGGKDGRERFFVSITVGGFAFGLIGMERIPHALMLILAAGVLMQWTNALAEASRRGARAVRLKQFSPRSVWVKAGITLVGVGAVAGVLALGGASAAAVLTGAACPPHDAGGVANIFSRSFLVITRRQEEPCAEDFRSCYSPF